MSLRLVIKRQLSRCNRCYIILRYPFISSEILGSEIDLLSEYILGVTVEVNDKMHNDQNNELLNKLFSILPKANKYPSTTLGYFSKCVLSLLRAKPSEVF
jgi:hypothetical protein